MTHIRLSNHMQKLVNETANLNAVILTDLYEKLDMDEDQTIEDHLNSTSSDIILLALIDRLIKLKKECAEQMGKPVVDAMMKAISGDRRLRLTEAKKLAGLSLPITVKKDPGGRALL